MCPGSSLWRDPATGKGRCAGRIRSRYVGVHRRDVFVRVAFELADCRPTAGEKVLTDTQRAGARDAMTLKGT